MEIICRYKNHWKYYLISLQHQLFQLSFLNGELPNEDLQQLYQNLLHHFFLQNFLNNLNIENLILKIKNKLKNRFISSEDTLITRERHRQHLEQSLSYLKNFEEKNKAEDFDKAAEDLRLATRHLGMIVGKVDVEEILGSIFNDFCIGK